MFQTVVEILLPNESQLMNTWVGHRFAFSREGTTDRLGDIMEIKEGKILYELPADVKPRKRGECEDRLPERCPEYASHGECTKNPGWMIMNCPVTCDACDLLDPKKRCDFVSRCLLRTGSDMAYSM